MDINPLNGNKTSPALRMLADQIDRGENPDFFMVINTGDGFATAHEASDDVFGLVGSVEWRKSLLLSEVE